MRSQKTSVAKTLTLLREELKNVRLLSQKVNTYITKSINLHEGLDFGWRTYYESERKQMNKKITDLVNAIDVLDDYQKSNKQNL